MSRVAAAMPANREFNREFFKPLASQQERKPLPTAALTQVRCVGAGRGFRSCRVLFTMSNSAIKSFVKTRGQDLPHPYQDLHPCELALAPSARARAGRKGG